MRLLVLLAITLAGCAPQGGPASPPTVVVIPDGPASPSERSPSPSPARPSPAPKAPAPSPVHVPPPTWSRRQNRSKRARGKLRERHLARHAATKAKVRESVVLTVVPDPERAPRKEPPKRPPKPKPPPETKPAAQPKAAPESQAKPEPKPAARTSERQLAAARWRDVGESLASELRQHLQSRGASYDRGPTGALRRFQEHAGLVVDGVYGPGTAGALRYFLKADPPPHYLRTKVQERPYSPPEER